MGPSNMICESVTYKRKNGVVVMRRGKPDNFDEGWTPEPNSGCWLWIKVLTNGYGYYRGKRAHRVSYERHVGPIPAGLYLDHLCRVPICVNPAHLEPVTPRENVMRGMGPIVNGQSQRDKTHCPKGHAYAGDNLYVNPNSGRRACRKCKAAFETKYRRERAMKEGG